MTDKLVLWYFPPQFNRFWAPEGGLMIISFQIEDNASLFLLLKKPSTKKNGFLVLVSMSGPFTCGHIIFRLSHNL